MKKTPIVIMSLVIIFLAFAGGYAIAKSEPRPLEQVIVEGDEMPGIGGTIDHPDTCVMWMPDDHIVHAKYAK